MIKLSGIDIIKYKAHIVRPVSVSKAYERSVLVDQILKAAWWSLERKQRFGHWKGRSQKIIMNKL